MKNVAVFLFDGYSDWEIAYITPEINRSPNFDLIYFSTKGNPVRSMGHLHVRPDSSLKAISSEDIDILILPGGEAWEKGMNPEIEHMIRSLHSLGKPIAAICAATTFLGRLGLLDDFNHTSNDLNYLKQVVPIYNGEKHYEDQLAVTDQNIITANGTAPIEFAREVFSMIELYDEDTLEKWYQLFKNGIFSD